MSAEGVAKASEVSAPMIEVKSPQPPKDPGNPAPTETITDKQGFRQKVWEHLENNRLVNVPRPVFGGIPNFKGAKTAADRLLELEEFKAAKSVEVSPDKPLEASRVLVLDQDKILYVPIPRLQEGLLKKIHFEGEKPKNLRQTVTRWGVETGGECVDFEDQIHIDMFVVGSVAVSVNGRRIGKGRGYADLEYAILKEMNAIDDSTVIVTTVHDSQVFDDLPQELFQKFDVPLDYILTPTRVIKVEERLPRPEGVYWNLLSERRVNLMPILKKIREMRSSEGKDTTLREVDTDIEADDIRVKRLKRFSRRRRQPEKLQNESDGANSPNDRPRRHRFFRRTKPASASTDKGTAPSGNDGRSEDAAKKAPQRFSRRHHFDFSLLVGNIGKDVRVRELKKALIDNGIKPSVITWRGYRGCCHLHYVKPPKKNDDKTDGEEEKPFGVDNVIEILQTLKLNSESTENLSVKVMEPITRIETTDVTAV